MKNKKMKLLILGIALITIAFVNYKVLANTSKSPLTFNKNHMKNSSVNGRIHTWAFINTGGYSGYYICIRCGQTIHLK